MLCFLLGCGGRTPRPADASLQPDERGAEGDIAADSGGSLCGWVPSGPSSVGRWERFEAAATVSTGDLNPFDPDQVDIRGVFEGPQGKSSEVPAFVYQGYQRTLEGGSEVLAPVGDPEWRVRFTPVTPGAWRWKMTANVGGSSCETAWYALDVDEAAPGHGGFVRVSGSDLRYLALDDGTPYLAVGENMAWYDGRGTFAYDDWMEKLAGVGGNYIRVWMASWGFGLEALEADKVYLGRYRLDRAWQLDHVVDRADELGIRLMLCLQYHGQLSKEVNSEWGLNPYNKANGGPLSDPLDFFTDDQARHLVRQRLRYVAARWGHATSLLAWELFNEVDYTSQLDAGILSAWHAEMADELMRFDPNGHLVTTSTSKLGDVLGISDALFSLPEMGIAQLHLYGGDGLTPDFTSLLPKAVAGLAKHGKPVLIGEAGVDFNGPAETLAADPEFTGFRDILWAGLLSGSAGTGMTWWWDNVIAPQNSYPMFQPVADILSGVDPTTASFQPVSFDIAANVRMMALRSDELVLGWVKNLDDLWFKSGAPGPVGPVSIPLELADGTWTVTWVATHDAPAPAPSMLEASGGHGTLLVPELSGDMAFRLVREP